MIDGVSSSIHTYSIGLGYSKLEGNKFWVDSLEFVIVNSHQSSGVSE